jgi:rare lipoprotein A
MSNKITILVLATLLLSACGTAKHKDGTSGSAAPNEGGYLVGDGPGKDIPANLDATPDAVLKNEPLHRYANRPYVALGKTYKPLTVVGNYKEHGIASWYGKKFNGERTSSGETYDMYAMSAAHPTLPIPSYARITNTANQKSVIVRINDRGPFINDRVIDLSYTAAYKLGILSNGSAEVEVESLAPDARITPVIASEPVQSKPLESSVPATPVAASVSAAASASTPPAQLVSLEHSDTNVYLQLGAFKSQEGAESFMEKMRGELGSTGKQLKLSNKDGLVRVHIGPYGSQSEARSSAESLENKLGFKPMVNLP